MMDEIEYNNIKKNRFRDFDNRDEFKRCYAKIKDGAIGRFIIENTRDLTKKMLINQFHSINIDDPQIKGRSRTNMRLLVLGGWIFEKVFGWELDLSKLTTAILSSEKMEVTDYISQLLGYLHTDYEQHEYQIDPRLIHAQGFVIDATQIKEIFKYEKKPSVKEFREVCAKEFLNVSEYKPISVNGSTHRGFLIPKESL